MHLLKTPWRICGVAGILFVTLSLVASGVNGLPPSFNQEKAVMPAWFSMNGQSYLTGHFLAGLALLLFYFPFFAGFCERLREAEGTPAIWSRVVWAGALMSPAAGFVAGASIVGIAFLGGSVAPDVARFGIAANFYAGIVSGALNGVAMVAGAIAILNTRVFWRWLGWAGVLIGLAAISGLAAIVENKPNGLFANVNSVASMAYFLWIAAVSVELIRARRSAPKAVSFDTSPVSRANLIDSFVGTQDKQNDIMVELKKLNKNVETLMGREGRPVQRKEHN